MAEALIRARLGVKSQMVLPKPVREALDLKPGDEFAFLIGDHEVRIVRAPARGDDPFACFAEWASEADRRAMPAFDRYHIVSVPFPYTDRAALERRPALAVSAPILQSRSGCFGW
jgi:antitoxin PrlF